MKENGAFATLEVSSMSGSINLNPPAPPLPSAELTSPPQITPALAVRTAANTMRVIVELQCSSTQVDRAAGGRQDIRAAAQCHR
jgi:hypothetical protein